MRVRGLFLCPPKKHPHPLDAKQPAGGGERPRGQAPRPLRDHGTHTPATTGHGTGQGTTGAQGHAWGARTTHANEATRRTFTTASDSEHSSISAKQQRKSSSREANSNDIEHSTLRHGHAELSDATKQREEHCITASDSQHDKATRTQQRSNTTTQRKEHSASTTRCNKDVTQQVSNQQAINQPSQRRAHADP